MYAPGRTGATLFSRLTFLTLSSSTGLVCCRRNKALVILQNFTRVMLEIGGQRHRIEHLITPGPAMFGGVLPPVECHVPVGLGTKTSSVCRLSFSWTSFKAKHTFLSIFGLDSANKRSHGVFRSECYQDQSSKSCKGWEMLRFQKKSSCQAEDKKTGTCHTERIFESSALLPKQITYHSPSNDALAESWF